MDNLGRKYCHMTLSERKNVNFQSTEKITIIAYFCCAGLSTNFTYFNTMSLPEKRKQLPVTLKYRM